MGRFPFVYPSKNAPDFNALGNVADATQDASVCNLDVEYQNDMCNTDVDFSTGPTQFLNTPKFRFPIFYEDADIAAQGHTDAARRYLNCALGSVCIFIRLEGPLNHRTLTVDYKYKPDIYVNNRTTDYATEPTPLAKN